MSTVTTVPEPTWIENAVKRSVDIALPVVTLPIVAPVMAVTAIAVRIGLGKPVLFSQVRAGLNGKPFRLFKYRSMTDEQDVDGNLLPDEQRLTPFGMLLRRTSLDELPQLLNVLRGEMSLVGPRPLPTEYVSQYSEEEALRLRAKPGITSLPAVSGRASLTWPQRMSLDVHYVKNWSLLLDVRILLKTVGTVLGMRNVHTRGFATSPAFSGTGIEEIAERGES